jgi:hypothetical protein
MANPNLALIDALRTTASRLKNGAYYAWGNHGGCNCGNLLQVVTQLTKEEILQFAHMGAGEWTEIAVEYCNTSQVPLYLLMAKLEAIGLTPTDIHNIEYLEDRAVLNALPGGFRWLKRNLRADVIDYFEAFANILEQELLQRVTLPQFIYYGEAEPLISCTV